uniref:Ig-like domain-containing protein n=1 Tax=Aquila chrysaetos chrysaetos TaxID=223781 RepID=A0A663F6S1_AQUCH
MGALRVLLGCREVPWGANRVLLGCRWVSWGALRVHLGCREVPWGAHGCSWGALRVLVGPLGCNLGAQRRLGVHMGALRVQVGPLGCTWALLMSSVTVPTVFPLVACSGGTSSSVVVACLVDGYFPEPVKVTWDSGTSPAVTRTFPASRRPSGTYTLGSQLRVTSGQPDSLQCTVEHPPSGFKKTTGIEGTGAAGRHFGGFPPPPPPPAAPPLLTSPPLLPSPAVFKRHVPTVGLFHACDVDSVHLVCLVSHFSPAAVTVEAQFNGTFTATSEVPISTHDWEGGETFTCTINHAELPSPISRSISKKPGKRLAPSVYLLAPPSEELSGNRDTLSLTCLVRGFYPEDISVEWQKNQETLDASTYDTVQPLKEKTGDASYFLYSRLVVKREEWNRGTTFVCMVVHEALPMKFIQRSISKSPGKK